MADLVTRLLLNSSQFDNNIKKSTLEIQSLQQTAKSVSAGFSNVVGTLGKFAGALGIALTAGQAFDKFLHSTLAIGDEWDNTVGAARDTVDKFFESLATFDFSAFNGGLLTTIENFKKVRALRDSLGDAKITMEYNRAEYESQFSRLEAIVRDRSRSLTERGNALEELKKLTAVYKQQVEDTNQGNITTIVETLNARHSNLQWGKEDVQTYISKYNNDFANTPEMAAFNKYKEDINELLGDLYTTTAMPSSAGTVYIQSINKEVEKQILLLKENNPLLEKMRLLNQDNDEVRKQQVEDIKYSTGLEKSISDYEKRILELNNAIKEGATVKPVIESGSIKEIETRISGLKTAISLEVDPATRTELYKELQLLEEKKRVIEFLYKYPTAPSIIERQPSNLAVKMELPTTLPKIEGAIKKKDVDITNDYVTSLNAVANAMTAINTANVEGAAGWISWAGSMMTATGTAIEAIRKVVAAKTAEAAASGAAEAAKTPVVGWLMVGGAIASILAAFSSLPSFSTGGIFAGNSTVGDMNLARVNAGEMILNNRQQRNLFNLLDGNGSATASGGEVTFKIQGKELVGVLSNYNSRLNKVR